jgi:hypothetical protein
LTLAGVVQLCEGTAAAITREVDASGVALTECVAASEGLTTALAEGIAGDVALTTVAGAVFATDEDAKCVALAEGVAGDVVLTAALRVGFAADDEGMAGYAVLTAVEGAVFTAGEDARDIILTAAGFNFVARDNVAGAGIAGSAPAGVAVLTTGRGPDLTPTGVVGPELTPITGVARTPAAAGGYDLKVQMLFLLQARQRRHRHRMRGEHCY